jgi:hypothetical protein
MPDTEVEVNEAEDIDLNDSTPDDSGETQVSGGSAGGQELPSESPPPQQGPGEVWGAFKSLPQFQGQDDRAIASRLYEALQREQAASRALQQYQQIIPYASDYLANREPFEQWRQAQQAAAQQTPASPATAPPVEQAEPSWWNPPKVRDAYKQYLVRDENGREIISPDAPLDAKHALSEYQAYKAEFAKKFLDNPEQTLGPMVEKVAVQRAEEIFQQKIGRLQEENYVSTLEKENSDWLYTNEMNPDGTRRVSAEGLAAQKYIQDARDMGIQGARARWEFATRMVERDLLLANMRMMQQAQQAPQQPAAAPPQANPADAAAQRNMEYLRQQAMRQASQRPATTTDARVPQKPMTFAEKLAANLQSPDSF